MLCQNCHEREATNFLTDGTKSRHLCQECFEAESPELKAFAAEMRTARCQYCGGQPCSGGTDILALITSGMTGVQKMKYMCGPCRREYDRSLQQQLLQHGETAGRSQEEQLAIIQTLRDEVDKHMQEWVTERGS